MKSTSGAIGGFIIVFVVTAIVLFILVQLAQMIGLHRAGDLLKSPLDIIFWLVGLAGGALGARWGYRVGLWGVISFWFNQNKNLPNDMRAMRNYYKQVSAQAKANSTNPTNPQDPSGKTE